MTGRELVLHRATLVRRAGRLAELEPEPLRAFAVRAASERDEATLWELLEAHLLLKGKKGVRVSALTLRNYRLGLVQFLVWAESAGVTLLHPRANMGDAYVRWLEGEYTPQRRRERPGDPPHLQRSSVQVHLSAARNLYAALRWANATDAAPFTDVRPSPDGVPRHLKRKAYSDEAVERLLAVAEEEGDQEAALIVLLAGHAGLRNAEIGGLLRQDVHVEDLDDPYLVVTGKGNRREEVPCSLRLAQALRRWLAEVPGGPRVLLHHSRPYLSGKVRDLARRADVEWERRELHGLRHTAGTRVYEQEGDLGAAQQFLRHRDPSSTTVYVDYARARKRKLSRDW